MGDKKRKKDMSKTGNTGGRNASISDAMNKVAKTVTKVATQKVQAPASKGNVRSGTRNNTQKTTVGKNQNRATTNRNAGRANRNRASFNERMNRYSAPSRREVNAQVTKSLKENVSGIAKGTAKRYAGQQLYGANDTANNLMDYFKKTSRTTGGDIGLKAGTEAFKFAYDNTIGKSNENLSRENIKKSMKRKGGELQESGQKDIEDVKKGKSNAGKFGVDLASTGMELGLDALLTRGRGTTAAMYNRAYGGAKKAAADEGANEEQAKLYGKASGLLEMGTEKMFSVAKPLQKLYGKGAGDDITETLLQKVTSKMAGTKGKNAVYHGGKTLTSAITEGLEEMVSEGLEPEIANRIYAEAVGKPHETNAKDIAYAGLLGGTMGGILGGGGQIVEYGQGRQVQEVFGEDGVKELAHKVKESDEDSGSSLMGAAIEEMINAGDSIVAGQARMLYQAAEEQNARDIRRSDITRTSADAIIQKENLVAPTQVDSETGQELLGKATARTFDTVKTKAADVAVELQMPELNSEQISDAVAKIQTGVAGVNEVNLFTIGNPKARTIYEVVTGKSLPKTNKETRETLYEQIALNRINAARAETESYVDRVKGIVQQNMSSGYESAGQRLFASEFGDVDVRDASQVEAAIITFDDFYRAGRNSIAYNDVIAMDNSIHQSMPESMRKAAWEAGQQDKILASDNAKGMQTVIGKTAKKTRSNSQKTGSKGKLISELSPEMREEFTASQQTVLRALARSFNINIHVVDGLENNANGMYVDGEVYLSMSGDRALPYIFAHEITHHMQSYAPKEYNQLKELVRQNWASRGGIDEAVDTKVAEYARHNVKLSREDALDEIIADSTYEMLQDEEFIDELCKSHRNIAQAVLDAIKNVLDKLRAVLAEGEGFTPAQNENLLSQLDILKDFERIWANGLARAAENSDAVGKLEQNNIRYSNNNEGSAIREQLRANIDVLKGMDTVADVKYESIKHLNRAQKADAIMREYDKKFKGGIERKDFGFIVIRKDEITNSLKYLHTDGEFAAFKALPQVLKRGEIIDEHINHKGRTIDTVTIAAPVIINGTPGYMAVAVKIGGKKRYHVHRILMPDGSEFEFNKKTEPIGAGMITVSSKQGSAISPVSDNSINQGGKNDNKKFSLGYHAGDLGKSESLANQSGGRSTGHFGTARYSFAGENALNKDNKMLRKAKDMYNDFEDSETIRKETGWHLGADGKWRFEIDDSQMEVFTAGDALFRKEHPEYARLQELYDKFWGEGVSEKEQKEMEELEETWGDEYARLHKRLESGNARLVDVIQHDVLFENYPQLENVKVKIGNLSGANGAYAVNGYEIKIDKELFKSDYRKAKRNATLVHEIQHAIQDIEKFAKGANLEMLDTATQRAESEAENAEELYEKAADNLTDILDSAGYYEKYGDYVDITSEDEQQRIRNENIPGANEALDNFNDYREKYFESVNKSSSLENMSPVDFYKYSAGEVEARDAGERAAYNAAERKAVRPDIDSPSIITEDYIRYSIKEDADISYESLVSKPDMEVVHLSSEGNKGLTRQDVVKRAINNVQEVGHKDEAGRNVISNIDTGREIVVGRNGIEHGMNRKPGSMAAVADHIGEYVRNAIKINGITPRGNAKDGYILLGYGMDDTGASYPVYFVIETLETGQDEIVYFDNLYSANAKKIEAPNNSGRSFQAPTSISTISISDLLDIVNEMYSDILPKSVAEHYGNEQRETKLGESVKYSMPDPDLTNEYINDHETEFIEVPPVRDYERRAAEGRVQSVGELQKQVERLKNEKKLTHGKILDTRSVREEMNKLVRTLMSRSEGTSKKTNHKLVDVGMDNISAIYRDIVEGDYASAANTAWYTAKEIVENLEFVDDTLFYEYKDLRDYLRTTKITLSEQDKAGFTDFKEFRGANMGRLRIVNNGGMAVDDVYESLCEKYPGLFDYEITHPVDQLKAMADVRESLEPYDIMLNSEEMEQLTKQAAQDIIDIAAEGKPWKSFADRKKEVYEQRLKQSKARHKEAMHELREVKNDELRRKLQKERDKKNEAITKEREKRKEAVAREKQKHKDYKENQKSRREHAKHYGRIFKNYKWLADRLVKPTDDKHIPQEFRTALAHMLQHFDFQTERSKALEEKYGPAQNTIRMYELKARFEKIAKEDGSGMFEYDGYIFDLMESLAIKLDGKSIDQASNEDLAAIDTLLKAITTNVRNYNKAFSEEINMTISDLAQKTIASNNERVAKHGKHADRSGIMGGVDSILNESMVTPRDFFEQVGGGLQDAFMAMRKGFDKHVDNLTKTRDFFDEVFKPYNKKTRLRKRAKPGSEVEKWRDSTMLEEIKLESGKTIKMNPAQMMTLYCSMKREQARGHILGSGIVVSKVDNASKIKRALGAKMQTEGSTVMISMTDANNIISRLTEEQIEMADKLQSFLNNECAEWGNEVSMKMYGYRKFTEKEYFPIKSADAYLDSNFEGRQPVERIKNFGFTKGTVTKANNPIMIDDIFRVISDHINKMSLYNAFAAPISDFTRVYNYRERDDSGLLETSVKSSLEDTYGKKVINYINNFMADVNNTAQTRTEGVTRFVNNSLAAYKKSIIGGNLRVALQQPTAVMRAFMLISPKYFVGGNVNVAKNLKDMMEHCQIARWKSWGHNQVDMARDIDEIMMNNEWGYIDAVTMEIYGALDNTTWSTIWAAVRKETKSKHPDVKENSEEFYQICNERASEIFDKTQVVDSVFHRSQVMRNTDIMSKMVTSFMAEPTRTFNMMRTEYVKAREMWNDGDKAKAVIHANKATSIFTLNAALVSAAAAVADVLRERAPGDDEDDTSWLTNFLANFWDNVNPINMIPVAKDIWGFKDGWGTQNMALEGYEALVQSVTELATAEDKAEAMRKVAEGLGLVTGLPVKNVLREVESISKLLGINVFAAEGGEETSKEEPGFLDKLINSFNIVDGTPFDNVLNRVGLNRTEAEQRAADEDKKVKSIERSIKGLSGEERQDKIWSEVTDNYTNYIKDGDFDSIRSMRSMLVALGGDVDKFDESVQGKMETALKKSLGENIPMVQQYKNYLMNECGMTEGKINQEVIMKSETAKNFQLAACTNDEVNMILAMADLYAAGLTDSEIDTLYATRSLAVKGRDFSTGEFAYPVSGEITSTFGYRDQPTAGATTYHEGIDIGVPEGSDVAAADGGKVSSVGYNSGLGYYVKIDHGNDRYTTYAHLSGYFVNKGDAVTKGQRIALSGSTGVSTGPHLHFAVQESGTYVDPMGYFN